MPFLLVSPILVALWIAYQLPFDIAQADSANIKLDVAGLIICLLSFIGLLGCLSPTRRS